MCLQAEPSVVSENVATPSHTAQSVSVEGVAATRPSPIGQVRVTWTGLHAELSVSSEYIVVPSHRTHLLSLVSVDATKPRPAAHARAVFAVERGFALEDPDGTLHRLPPR